MSDRSKISHYFTRAIEIPLQEPSNTYVNATVNTDIVNTTETAEFGGGDEISQCSSTIFVLHDQNEISESGDDDDLLQASATDRDEQLISLKADSYKRDPVEVLQQLKNLCC
jgi:hypothetical protein